MNHLAEPAGRQLRRLDGSVRAPRSRRSFARFALALGVTLVLLAAAFASDEPLVMLVGTFPIGWIAVEFCWCASRVSQAREDK